MLNFNNIKVLNINYDEIENIYNCKIEVNNFLILTFTCNTFTDVLEMLKEIEKEYVF